MVVLPFMVARDTGVVGITLIIAAIFSGIGSSAATIITALNRRDIRTGNGRTIGQQVQETADHIAQVKQQIAALPPESHSPENPPPAGTQGQASQESG